MQSLGASHKFGVRRYLSRRDTTACEATRDQCRNSARDFGSTTQARNPIVRASWPGRSHRIESVRSRSMQGKGKVVRLARASLVMPHAKLFGSESSSSGRRSRSNDSSSGPQAMARNRRRYLARNSFERACMAKASLCCSFKFDWGPRHSSHAARKPRGRPWAALPLLSLPKLVRVSEQRAPCTCRSPRNSSCISRR